jgi:hypothetical protein
VGYAALAVGGELNLSEASTLTALFNGYVSDPWPVLTHLVFAGLTWWFVQGGCKRGGAGAALDDAGPVRDDAAAGGDLGSPCRGPWPGCASS